MADENFPAGDEPLHVGGFDIVRVEEIAARPNHGGGAVAEAAELFAFKLRRMFQMVLAMINIALARPALEEHRDRQQLLPFLDGAQQARSGDFADIPLAVQILVMALAGRNKVWIDIKLVAFDTDLAIDDRLAARMIGQTQRDFRFIRHDSFLSNGRNNLTFKSFKPFNRLRSVQAPTCFLPRVAGEDQTREAVLNLRDGLNDLNDLNGLNSTLIASKISR